MNSVNQTQEYREINTAEVNSPLNTHFSGGLVLLLMVVLMILMPRSARG